jgi:hypothetical protein
MNNRFQVALFGRYERESMVQIKSHLMTKNALGSRSSTIGLLNALFKDAA